MLAEIQPEGKDSTETTEPSLGRVLGVLAVVILIPVALMAACAAARAQHNHPPQDAPVHEKFYQHWYMPDQPNKPCCNKADCYPTEARFMNGGWQAKRREDGKWLRVPAVKVEQHRDNPDGRNHLCAPPPDASYYPPDTVFCFALGGGT